MRRFLLSNPAQHNVWVEDYCRHYPEDSEIPIAHHRERGQLSYRPSGSRVARLRGGPAARGFESKGGPGRGGAREKNAKNKNLVTGVY